jgi:hypothetical protein
MGGMFDKQADYRRDCPNGPAFRVQFNDSF